jgi:hypothetical protein
MGTRIEDVVHGYNALAASLLERWGERTAKFAEKIDDGKLDASTMTSELVSCTTLATQTAVELMEEALEAAIALGGARGDCEVVTSKPFAAPAGASLKLTGPLQKGAGLGELAVQAITLQPQQLGPEETSFTLAVDAYGCRGGTYVGTVEATTDESVTIVVWITVP